MDNKRRRATPSPLPLPQWFKRTKTRQSESEDDDDDVVPPSSTPDSMKRRRRRATSSPLAPLGEQRRPSPSLEDAGVHGHLPTPQRNTPSPLSSFFRRSGPERLFATQRKTPSPLSSLQRMQPQVPSPVERGKFHPSRLLAKALEKLSPTPKLLPHQPVKVITGGSTRIDEGITVSIRAMAKELLGYQDTHAWLASDHKEADLFISRELQRKYFEAHQVRLGVRDSTFGSHYWTREIRSLVLEEVRNQSASLWVLPWFIRSSLDEAATSAKLNVLIWALWERRKAEKLGAFVTAARALMPHPNPTYTRALEDARTELVGCCAQTTEMTEAIYTRALAAVARVRVSRSQDFPLPSRHAQLVYRDSGLKDATDATEEGQLDGLVDWSEEDEEIELPVGELGAGAIQEVDLDAVGSINLEGYLEAVKEDALVVLRGDRLGPLLAMQLHKLTSADALDPIDPTTAFGPAHFRNTLGVLGNIYRSSSSSSKVLIEKILVLGAFRLLSSNYGLYSIMFLHLLEAAFLELEAQDKHETSPSRQELFRIRQFGEAWMLSTGHASKSSDRREYGVVRQTRTAKWLSAIGTFAGDCGLCYMPYDRSGGFVKGARIDPQNAMSVCVRLRRGTLPVDRQLCGGLLACQPCLFHFFGSEYHPFAAIDFLHWAFICHKRCKAGRGKVAFLTQDC